MESKIILSKLLINMCVSSNSGYLNPSLLKNYIKNYSREKI